MFDQLKLSGIKDYREVGDSENRACEISLARLSAQSRAASAAGIQATFICGGFPGEADAKL